MDKCIVARDGNRDPIPDSPRGIHLLGDGDGNILVPIGNQTGKIVSPSGITGAGMICHPPSPFPRVPAATPLNTYFNRSSPSHRGPLPSVYKLPVNFQTLTRDLPLSWPPPPPLSYAQWLIPPLAAYGRWPLLSADPIWPSTHQQLGLSPASILYSLHRTPLSLRVASRYALLATVAAVRMHLRFVNASPGGPRASEQGGSD
jgi:hypothetical protein